MGLVAMAVTLGGSAAAVGDAAGVIPEIGKKKSIPVPPMPRTSNAGNEDAAQKEAEKRRRQYANMGRSSTILTQGMNLGTIGPNDSAPKQLLGL